MRRRALGRKDSATMDGNVSAIATPTSIARDRACTAGAATSATARAATLRRDSMRIVSTGGDEASVGDIHAAAAGTILTVTSQPARTTGAAAITAGAAKLWPRMPIDPPPLVTMLPPLFTVTRPPAPPLAPSPPMPLAPPAPYRCRQRLPDSKRKCRRRPEDHPS